MAETRSGAWISPPGETIEDLLEERGWTKVELAHRLGKTPKHVSELVSGKATISAEMATDLARVLGSSAEFWLERESRYRAALERLKAAALEEDEAAWLRELPLSWMKENGLIPKISGRTELREACLRFFGVASVKAWAETYGRHAAAFRASPAFQKEPAPVATWLRRGERIATEIRCQPWDERGFKLLLADLRALTLELDPERFVPRLIAACAKKGVAVVVASAPPGCPLSGATRWLSPEKAMLALSMRHKSNDHLWFTFFHEAGHLLLHGKKMAFIEGLTGLDPALEAEADSFAGDCLIPRQVQHELPGIRSRAAVEAFARQVGVHPGIVVGRLQHDGHLPWNRLNDLKQHFGGRPAQR